MYVLMCQCLRPLEVPLLIILLTQFVVLLLPPPLPTSLLTLFVSSIHYPLILLSSKWQYSHNNNYTFYCTHRMVVQHSTMPPRMAMQQ